MRIQFLRVRQVFIRHLFNLIDLALLIWLVKPRTWRSCGEWIPLPPSLFLVHAGLGLNLSYQVFLYLLLHINLAFSELRSLLFQVLVQICGPFFQLLQKSASRLWSLWGLYSSEDIVEIVNFVLERLRGFVFLFRFKEMLVIKRLGCCVEVVLN